MSSCLEHWTLTLEDWFSNRMGTSDDNSGCMEQSWFCSNFNIIDLGILYCACRCQWHSPSLAKSAYWMSVKYDKRGREITELWKRFLYSKTLQCWPHSTLMLTFWQLIALLPFWHSGEGSTTTKLIILPYKHTQLLFLSVDLYSLILLVYWWSVQLRDISMHVLNKSCPIHTSFLSRQSCPEWWRKTNHIPKDVLSHHQQIPTIESGLWP